MKKLVCFIALLLCIPGCGFYALDRTLQTVEKLAEMQLQIEKERRAQTFTIEGEIKKVETIKVIKELEAAKEMEKEIAELKKTKGAKVDIKTTREFTVYNVSFADGREKEFRKVPTKPLDAGSYYIITYNGMDEITEIQRKK